jgi:hypothetical protein
MYLDLNVAGRVERWRFRDSEAASAWISGRPWIEDGSVAAVCMSDAALVEPLARMLPSAVFAADQATTRVAVFTPADESEQPKSLALALTPYLVGESVDCDLRQLRAHLLAFLSRQPAFFTVAPKSASAFLDDAVKLADDIAKMDTKYPLSLLLLETPDDRSGATPSFDLSVGGPIGSIFETEYPGRRETWKRFLHIKAAWESAGDAASAMQLGTGFGAVSEYDDEGVELACNESARARASSLPATIVGKLQEYLATAYTSTIAKPERMRTQTVLTRAGVLWKPLGCSEARPTPWIARAMLLDGSANGAECLLRNCLVPASLSRDLLTKCFELEAQERAVYWGTRVILSPLDEVQAAYDAFAAGKPNTAARFYPQCCPVKPQPWDFASMGQFFFGLSPDGATSARTSVRDIRNALSHGHYVSWRMLNELLESNDQLLNASRVIASARRATAR